MTYFSFYQEIVSQAIPKEFFNYKISQIGFDHGKRWEILTNFSSIRYQQIYDSDSLKNDLLISKTRYGFLNKNQYFAFYGYGHFRWKKHFFAYFYPRVISNNYVSSNTSVIPTYISKEIEGLDEHNLSGIGYQNDWVTLQLSKGQENWGAGNNIQLSLSEYSKPYDYFMLASNYGYIRVSYIHGFLETTFNGINRYINARGLEWTNKKSFLIGLSETIIYSGMNRSIDIGYINPINSHLEVELNNRLNILGNNNSNAVWQFHLDCYIKEKFRLSGNYLYDEFVIDPKIQKNKEHGKAYSYRIAYTPMQSKKSMLTLYFSYVYIGTPTFRHVLGENNFVQNDKPLGWIGASDGSDIKLGFNFYNFYNLFFTTSVGFYKVGEESISNRVFDPFADYLEGSFPSGMIITKKYIDGSIKYFIKSNINFSFGYRSIISNFNVYNAGNLYLGLNVFFNQTTKFVM